MRRYDDDIIGDGLGADDYADYATLFTEYSFLTLRRSRSAARTKAHAATMMKYDAVIADIYLPRRASMPLLMRRAISQLRRCVEATVAARLLPRTRTHASQCAGAAIFMRYDSLSMLQRRRLRLYRKFLR